MLNEIQIERDLHCKLSLGRYRGIIDDLNAFRTISSDRLAHQKPGEPYTPASVAGEAAHALALHNMLLNPKVEELTGYVELYRAHDGGAGTRRGSVNSRTAGTLGGSWVSLDLVANIWRSCKEMSRDERKQYFKDTLRYSTLVREKWNAMTHWVCMQVPAGCSVVVVVGKGNWKAMYPKDGSHLAPDLKNELSLMSKEPPPQYFVPAYRSSWVFPIEETSPSWPFMPRR